MTLNQPGSKENTLFHLNEGKEGKFTKSVEQVTARVPSIGYLALALGSMALSVGFKLMSSKRDTATFVGLWAPTFLLLGIYNKLVKVEGSERHAKAA